MAPANARKATQLYIQACRTDDVPLMEQAIEAASQDSQDTVRKIIQKGLGTSTTRSALRVLQYVLDHGADIQQLYRVTPTVDEFSPDDATEKPSTEVLEILIAHGWDINTHSDDGWPLLWTVVRYPDLVQWCLNHGARVDFFRGPPEPAYYHDPPQVRMDVSTGPNSATRGPRTVLGSAASSGSIETFELLRARGAPLDPRTLHIAVERNYMDMVRHLVDVVGLKVNAIVQRPDGCATPLCCIAGPRLFHENHLEIIEFLLDRGADPDLDRSEQGTSLWASPVLCAQRFHNERFLQVVQEWRARQEGSGSDAGVLGMAQRRG